MAEVKQKYGKMGCETCGEPVTVKANERGTLSYGCQECDAAPYAKRGTGQHAVWVKKCETNAPAPAPAPRKEPSTDTEIKQPKQAKQEDGLLL